MMMKPTTKPLASAAVTLVLSALAPLAAAQESPERILPKPSAHVEDLAGVVDSSARASLERVLSALESETRVRVVFLTIDTTRPVDIENFTLQNAQAWELGESGEAALLVVAVRDRLWHITVSDGLEDVLDGAFVRRLGAEALLPRLRRGDYGGALESAAADVSRRVRDQLPVESGGTRTTAPRSDRRSPPPRPAPRSRGPGCGTGLVTFLVILFVIGAFSRGGTGFGCGAPGCAGPGCLPGFFLGTLLGGGGFGRRRRRSWGGYGPWGGFGGGGGGVFRGSGGGGGFSVGGGFSSGGGGSVFRGGGGGGSW